MGHLENRPCLLRRLLKEALHLPMVSRSRVERGKRGRHRAARKLACVRSDEIDNRIEEGTRCQRDSACHDFGVRYVPPAVREYFDAIPSAPE